MEYIKILKLNAPHRKIKKNRPTEAKKGFFSEKFRLETQGNTIPQSTDHRSLHPPEDRQCEWLTEQTSIFVEINIARQGTTGLSITVVERRKRGERIAAGNEAPLSEHRGSARWRRNVALFGPRKKPVDDWRRDLWSATRNSRASDY